MNLIEQQNVLKGLTDESLQAELAQPSGQAPPFLLATEISRRKAARERYEGDKARQAKSTTVMEDLMGGMPVPATAGIPAAAGPSGIAAALPPAMGAAPAPVAAFAEGGLVGGIDYADIGRRYQERLDALPEQRDRAQALALIKAGAAMAGNGSSNFFKNFSAGANAGVDSYTSGLAAVDDDETKLLTSAIDLNHTNNTEDLARMQFDFDKQREANANALTREGWMQDKEPASIRTTKAYMEMTPEEQAVYDKQNPAYNPNQLTNDMRATTAANEAFDQALKALPPPLVSPVSEADALAQAKNNQRQAALLAYPKWLAILGTEGARQMARQYGLTDGDIVAGSSAPPADGGDPNKQDYSTYFN